MNHFKVQNKRQGLDFEIAFTKAYRQAKKQYAHPAQVELACLRAQYPAILHPIQEEDLFAGRHDFGAVGLGIQHQTGGFGYFIDEARVVYALEQEAGSAAYREGLHEMLTFWRSENSSAKVMHDMPEDIRKALPSDEWDKFPLPATPILRMAGTYLDFDKLVRVGIPGLYAEMRAHLERAQQTGGDATLFECMIGSLDLFVDVCRYYQRQAVALAKEAKTPTRATELMRIAASLAAIQTAAPASLHEAIQLAWLYGLITPAIEYGRLDIYLGDLYVQDVDSGAITDADAVAMVQSFFRLIDHLDCETDGRAIVGGYGRRNTENADRFCLIAMEACRTVHEVLPQFTLRFNHETPRPVWDAAMRCIEEGRTYPLLYNDDVLVPAIMKEYGVDRARAESYVPLGCGEFEFDHYSFATPSGALNAVKILEIAMNGGWEPVGRRPFGPQTKGLRECATFAEFYDIYKQHLAYYIDAQAKFEAYEYQKAGELHAFMYVSMLYDGCPESGKAIFNGGCQSYHGTLELYGVINAADSLTAINRLVFEQKLLTADQLLAILADNFTGHERERKLMQDCSKYGNDDAEADGMAVALQRYLCQTIIDQAPKVGLQSYFAVIINNAQNTTLARWAGASPDGRKAGTPYANANNPSMGADKNGVTAMLNSLLKMPTDNNAGMVQNLRFTRELFEGSRPKVLSLIDSYFARGGAQLMVTVVGKDDLARALENPDGYKDLIVRVGGFSARFVDLPKDVQKEIYERVTY